MRPARIIATVSFAAIIAVTGCTAGTNADQPSPPPTHRTDPSPLDRQAPIYAAVLRQYLTSGGGHYGSDAGFAADYRFPRIFVLDHTVAGADAPGPGGSGGGPIPAAVRRAVTRSLADVGPLSFVPSPDTVIGYPCARVLDRGILITLGPVEGVGDRVQVGINGHVSCVAASWLAYWVERTRGGWRVAGVAARGPVA